MVVSIPQLAIVPRFYFINEERKKDYIAGENGVVDIATRDIELPRYCPKRDGLSVIHFLMNQLLRAKALKMTCKELGICIRLSLLA